MKILQVCAYAAPYPGNFINSLENLENEIKKLGYETMYAFPHNAKNMEWCQRIQARTKVFFLPLKKARLNLKTFLDLRKIMVSEKVSIVHSHFELYDLPISIILPKNVKQFWHLHDPVEEGYKNTTRLRKYLYILQYKTFQKDAYLISVSEKHKKFVVRLGFKQQNTVVLPNGLDLARIQKRKKQIPKAKIDFLIFGWDFKRKGVDLGIQAAKRLENEGYEFTLGVVGNENTWLEEDLIKNSNQKWLSKQYFVKDINELYKNTRSFLHLSRAEGLSYALLEAAYAGLPVVCSNIDENIFAKKMPSVIFYNSENVEEIYEIMKSLLEEEKINFDMIKTTQNIIEEEYSINYWTDRMIEIYKTKGNLN